MMIKKESPSLFTFEFLSASLLLLRAGARNSLVYHVTMGLLTLVQVKQFYAFINKSDNENAKTATAYGLLSALNLFIYLVNPLQLHFELYLLALSLLGEAICVFWPIEHLRMYLGFSAGQDGLFYLSMIIGGLFQPLAWLINLTPSFAISLLAEMNACTLPLLGIPLLTLLSIALIMSISVGYLLENNSTDKPYGGRIIAV